MSLLIKNTDEGLVISPGPEMGVSEDAVFPDPGPEAIGTFLAMLDDLEVEYEFEALDEDEAEEVHLARGYAR